MVKRGGCANTDCNCHLHAGDGLEVEGIGTENNPYVITAIEGATLMRAESTSSVTLKMEGHGTSGDPYVLSGELSTDPVFPAARVQRFTSNGTWTKPPGTKVVMVTVIGGGGGGGAGAGLASTGGTVTDLQRGPGMGGSGGGWSRRTFREDQIPETVSIVVGTGGNGGAAVVGSNTSPPGTAGGLSSFGNLLTAGGGQGGTLEPQSGQSIPPSYLPIVIYPFRNGSNNGFAYTNSALTVGTNGTGVSLDGQPAGSIWGYLPNAGSSGWLYSDTFTVQSGSTIYTYGYVKMFTNINTSARLVIWWSDGTNSFGSYVTASPGGWTLFSWSGTVPAGVTWMRIGCEGIGYTMPATVQPPYTSRINWFPSPRALGPYPWGAPAPACTGPNNITFPTVSLPPALHPGATTGQVLRMTGCANGYTSMYAYGDGFVSVAASTVYVFSAYFQRNSHANWTDRRVRFNIDFYNSGGGYLGTHTGGWQDVATSPDWYRYHSGAWATPGGTAYIKPNIEVLVGGGASGSVYMNVVGFLLETGAGLGSYFDGYQTAYSNITYAWEGASNNSRSIETTDPPDTPSDPAVMVWSWMEADVQGLVKLQDRAQGTEPGGSGGFTITDLVGNTYWSPSAGGRGGIATATVVTDAAGRPGGYPQGPPQIVSTVTPPMGLPGAAGPAAPADSNSGGGGGSGGSGAYSDGTVTYTAQPGGAGGYPGGGGGGGGQSPSGQMPGTGGRGADGYVEVVSW